jgi:hypothetical protein
VITLRDFGLTTHPAHRDWTPVKPTSIWFALLRLLPARGTRRGSEHTLPTTPSRCPAVPSFFPFDVRDLVGDGRALRK